MNQQQPITSTGRNGLYQAINNWFQPSGAKGNFLVGGRPACHPLPDGSFLCSAHSLFMEGIHVDLTYQSMLHIGYKSAVSITSQLIVHGCQSIQLSVQLALPRKITSSLLKDFYEGFRKGTEEAGGSVSGTDVGPSSGNLVISVTGTGIAPAGRYSSDNQFSAGDLVAITGYPGRSYAGLRILLREKEFFQSQPDTYKPNLSRYSWVVERYLAPRLPMDTLATLSTKGIRPTTASVIKNGLANDIHQLIQSSGTGIEIEETLLPSHEKIRSVADEFGDDDLQYMLYGGDDYQFLFTFHPDNHLAIDDIDDLTVIGTVTEEAGQLFLLSPGDGRRPVDPLG